MIYTIGDTHFHHTSIIKYCDRNFASIGHMNSWIIEQWNKTIADDPDPVIFHLGDVGFGKYDQVYESFRQLNGTIHLIKGNHDRLPDHQYLSMGFASVQKQKKLRIDGTNVLLQHRPMATNEFLPPGISHVIHGHIHNNIHPSRYNLNCSVEVIDYCPVTFPDLIKCNINYRQKNLLAPLPLQRT